MGKNWKIGKNWKDWEELERLGRLMIGEIKDWRDC
jgi:hypothetical protein